MNFFVVAIGLAVAGTSLQGCASAGSSTSKPTTSTATIITTTTTTTTTTPLRPDPRNGQLVANQMNADYNGYRKGDSSSPAGVYIRATTSIDIYCGKGCFQGCPDCRISGSVMNYMQMHDRGTGHPGGLFGDEKVGYYVNSTVVKSKLAKCTYAWDGATMGKVNFGCGCQQGESGQQEICNRSNPAFEASAYNNKVPPNFTETSGAESSNVKPCWCTPRSSGLPANGNGAQCFWKAVAFDTKLGDSEDETHKMLEQRIDHSDGSGPYGDAVLAWNEMILDGERMLDSMFWDPAGTISAIVYGSDGGSVGTAQRMATELRDRYGLSRPVPVIQMRQYVDVRSGQEQVFVFQPQDQPQDETLV